MNLYEYHSFIIIFLFLLVSLPLSHSPSSLDKFTHWNCIIIFFFYFTDSIVAIISWWTSPQFTVPIHSEMIWFLLLTQSSTTHLHNVVHFYWSRQFGSISSQWARMRWMCKVPLMFHWIHFPIFCLTFEIFNWMAFVENEMFQMFYHFEQDKYRCFRISWSVNSFHSPYRKCQNFRISNEKSKNGTMIFRVNVKRMTSINTVNEWKWAGGMMQS